MKWSSESRADLSSALSHSSSKSCWALSNADIKSSTGSVGSKVSFLPLSSFRMISCILKNSWMIRSDPFMGRWRAHEKKLRTRANWASSALAANITFSLRSSSMSGFVVSVPSLNVIPHITSATLLCKQSAGSKGFPACFSMTFTSLLFCVVTLCSIRGEFERYWRKAVVNSFR